MCILSDKLLPANKTQIVFNRCYVTAVTVAAAANTYPYNHATNQPFKNTQPVKLAKSYIPKQEPKSV